MDKLFELILYVDKYGYTEGFEIGIFTTYEKAIEIKNKYINKIQGFKDYDCDYEIVARQIIGDVEGMPSVVFQFIGWSEDEDGDEVDVYYSDCYIAKDVAKMELEKCKKELQRNEWVLNCIEIDKCHWDDGFVRVEVYK